MNTYFAQAYKNINFNAQQQEKNTKIQKGHKWRTFYKSMRFTRYQTHGSNRIWSDLEGTEHTVSYRIWWSTALNCFPLPPPHHQKENKNRKEIIKQKRRWVQRGTSSTRTLINKKMKKAAWMVGDKIHYRVHDINIFDSGTQISMDMTQNVFSSLPILRSW